ncbi:hypothetical protein KGF54_004528 [Candida jiufengensis]|uniref:uncharacterized protein n=1 Tax=Candida jiufengensis TaxID=497108 RepID=UPI002224E437|nr:uncharacterized protein KGF54_004528 [Candida jiufengensis]KAI5951454.1 hypothetical protein KGF54_004528 [Candida jiufengensis]
MNDEDEITTNVDSTRTINDEVGSKSRLRKFDKLIINQSSYMDEDDQIEYIKELNKYNNEQYVKYKIYLVIYYGFQILTIIFMNFKIKNDNNPIQSKVILVLFLISIILNLVQVTSKSIITKLNSFLQLLIKMLSIVINLQILYFIYHNSEINLNSQKGIFILIILNFILPYFHEFSFNSINQSVNELNDLKYKYKNV